MLQARRPCQSILLRAVSRTGERAGSRGRLGCGRWVAGALLAVLGLAGCKLFIDETTESKYPKMSPEARAVKIYYSGEQPECLEVLRLGRVQAKAGDFPDPDPQFISPQVHMDVALASTAKVYGSETVVEVLRQLVEIVCASALVRSGSAASALLGELEYEVRAATINTFGGGTNELQRELIAQFGLGLPRAVR